MFVLTCSIGGPPGVFVYQKLSLSCLYAISFSVMFAVLTTTVGLYRLTRVLNAGENINNLIFDYMCLLYCIAQALAWLIHCFEASKVAAYLNAWTQLQVTGRQKVTTLQRKISICYLYFIFIFYVTLANVSQGWRGVPFSRPT